MRYVLLGICLVLDGVFANSMVCSNENLYFSSVQNDYGVQPLPGTLIGKFVLVYEGKTLLNQNLIVGQSLEGEAPYKVHLLEKPIMVETSEVGISISKIFKQTALLLKVESTGSKEITRENVICRSTWVIYP